MKIETFHTLAAVLETGTFAAAARQTNVTPSAVSMQMKQLEQYLGRPLFDRSGLQARPNRLAHQVSETMQQALQNLEALRTGSSLAVEGVVRLGIIESLQPVLLPGIVRFVRERHPRLELRLERGRSSTLTASVKAGELDAALVAQPPTGGTARLRWTPMLRRELVLIAPPGAMESNVASLFRLYDWIRYDRNTVSGALAAQYVGNHVPEIRGTVEFDSAPAIVAMVSAGLGVSIVQSPDPVVLQGYPVRIVRLGRAAPVLTLSMVTRKADDDNRSVAAVRDAMRHTAVSFQRAVAAAH
ncbi:LysR family transcriptional regulator [Cupriavidus gilardii]|uniref:LysR family transcriptional regulator n=1 Tax=Cupriavidus gilardii TaxID=82541 RepID=A0ABY4VS26_9BURK|nr:LysR family transcriptional regulator [Cupriavidus gilardii]MCT9117901.1 LysR family transcriptional regulator [Cupriavidus gilardii]QQE09596.1 LysR family transcriptional regulator [Cupriavidus sp. ISTL7]USE77520.1 LysR family transcriptional regulator [Cupriavidus gilardii]